MSDELAYALHFITIIITHHFGLENKMVDLITVV